MKKTILASIVAGLFTVAASAAFAAGGISAGAGEHGHKMMKLEFKAEAGEPTVITVEQDGQSQEFVFTAEDLDDMAAVEASLSDLDAHTREMILNALRGDHGALLPDGIHGDKEVIIIKKGAHDMDGEHERVIELHTDGGEHHRVIKLHGDGGHHVIKHFIGEGEGKQMKFKMGHGGAHKMLHHDSKHSVKMIEQLIKHSDLTAEQIEAIRQQLDEK